MQPKAVAQTEPAFDFDIAASFNGDGRPLNNFCTRSSDIGGTLHELRRRGVRVDYQLLFFGVVCHSAFVGVDNQPAGWRVFGADDVPNLCSTEGVIFSLLGASTSTIPSVFPRK